MSSYDALLVERYKSKGLLVDSNLLLLHVIGSHDIALVGNGRFNKLSQYTVVDFRILQRLLAQFAKAFTTAHVLTEVSNLINDFPESTKISCLGGFIALFETFNELSCASVEVTQRPEFCYLGLTDTALAHLSKDYLIVTSDARFVGIMNQHGLEALNFNHLREYLLRA